MHRQCLGFVVKETVCREGGAQVHHEVVYGPVSGVCEVGLVLEQLVDALYDVPLPEHDLVPHGHEPVLHVGPESMYEVGSTVKEVVKELLLDIAPVGEHFPIEFFGEHAPHPIVPVIGVSPCQTEGYHLPGIVTEQVRLEAVAPSHDPLAVLGQPSEHFVEVAPDVVAHGDHRAVDKRDARAFAKGIQLHEHHHLEEYPRHELHEAIVGNGIGELLPELPADADEVVLLEVAVRAEVIAYQDGHNLTLGKLSLAVATVLSAAIMGGQPQVLVKLIDNTENCCNFVFGNHRLIIL